MKIEDLLFEIDNRRQTGKCYHELSDITMIVLCGYVSDCEGFEEVYDYAIAKEEVLRGGLALPFGISSHDTLKRVFRLLASAQLEGVLSKQGKRIVRLLAHSW